MKPILSQILIGSSVFASVAFGYRLLRAVYLLFSALPEEIGFYGWSPMNFLRGLAIYMLPIVLYATGFLFHRDSVSSHLGKAALWIDIAYLIAAIASAAYIYHFASRHIPNA